MNMSRNNVASFKVNSTLCIQGILWCDMTAYTNYGGFAASIDM